MADPIADIIGDYRAFAALQRDPLLARGIDIAPYELSHLVFRAPEWDQHVHARTLLERHAVANRENVWNGRPISLIVPAQPLDVLDGKVVPLIELIPPVHQRVYKMGLEHLGVVVGDTFDAVVETHKPVLTGQQFQGPNSTPDPVYILMEDITHVKFLPTLVAGIRRALRRPVRRRVPPRRRLAASAAYNRDSPEPSAALSDATPSVTGWMSAGWPAQSTPAPTQDRSATGPHKPVRTYELGRFRLGSRRHHSRTNRAEKRATAK